MLRVFRLASQRLRTVCTAIIPYLLLMGAPFFVFWRLWTPSGLNRIFIYQDTTLSRYPNLVFLVDCIRQYAEIPLWSWGIYSGIPFQASFHNSFLYPLNAFFYCGILDVASAVVYNLYMLFHLGIAGVSFFVLARSFYFSKTASFCGALTYMFGGVTGLLIAIGPSFYSPHAWLPLTLYFVRKFVLNHKPAWILLGGLFFALIISSLMPLIVIPSFYFLIIFFVCSVVIEKKTDMAFMLTRWFVVSIILAFSLVAVQLCPVMEISLTYMRQSVSSFLHARDVYWERDVMIVIKEYFWGGDHAFAYLGAVGGLLALIGILTRTGKYYLFWMATFLITIIAFYTSKDFALYDFFYIFLPKIKNINAMCRNVGSIYVISGAFLIMTAITYGRKLLMITKQPGRISKALFIWIGAVAIMLWLVYKPDEINAVRDFSVRYTRWLFVLILVAMIILTMRVNKYRRTGIAIILGFFAIELLSFVANSVVPENLEHSMLSKEEVFTAEDNLLVKFESPYIMGRSAQGKLPSINKNRISQFRNNTSLIQGKDNTGGYYPTHPHRSAQAMWASGQRDHYVFHGPQPGLEEVVWPAQIVNKLYDLDPKGKGRAWVVTKNIETSTPPLKELSRETFDPYNEVYLENEDYVIKKEFGQHYFRFYKIINDILTPDEKSYTIESDGSFTINDDLTLLKQTPNSAVIRLEKDIASGVLFFSDNWYPGWAAYVNGKRVPLYVANYTFKGIKIEGAKASIIEFVFDPPIIKIGCLVSVMAVLVMITLLCLPRVYRPIVRRVKSV